MHGTTSAEAAKETAAVAQAAKEEGKWALQVEAKWVPAAAAVGTITMEKETAALAVEGRWEVARWAKETYGVRSFSS